MATQIMNANTAFSQPAVDLEGSDPLYATESSLFQVQPVRIQKMLEMQASLISKAIVERQSPLRFMLPDQVICEEDEHEARLVAVPADRREQKVGGFLDRLKSSDIDRLLKELENSEDKALSTCGRMMRFAIAWHMVYRMAEVPQLSWDQRSLSAYSLNFFLPQLVALDEHDNLLVNSIEEAKTCIAAQQRCLSMLKMAIWLAPYFRFDAEYRRKHQGVSAQLIIQGRALARHQTGDIIRRIQRRVADNSLNRGFSLSLPFFDDQALEMMLLDIEIIPCGRIMFAPAFVVIAIRAKEMEVAHSPGLSQSTRHHILDELKVLEQAFDQPTK